MQVTWRHRLRDGISQRSARTEPTDSDHCHKRGGGGEWSEIQVTVAVGVDLKPGNGIAKPLHQIRDPSLENPAVGGQIDPPPGDLIGQQPLAVQPRTMASNRTVPTHGPLQPFIVALSSFDGSTSQPWNTSSACHIPSTD